MSYVFRVKEEFCRPGTEPRDTEALLVRTGTNWMSFEILTSKKRYPTLIEYLEDNAVSPFEGKWWDPWMFIEVLVKTLELYNSNWISGLAFKDGTTPSEPPSYIPTPPPAPSHENVAPFLATFQIRHNKKKDPAAPSTPRSATLTFSDENDHSIKEGPAKLHYHSVHEWHNGSFATEEDIAKDREKNGTAWAHVHVLVDDRWIPGLDFIAMRNTPP
jgi:hypothetical protein